MKKVWVIAPFADIDTAGERNRFKYIANRLNKEKFEVFLFTNNFNHMKKIHIDSQISKNCPYMVEIIHEPGYKKNVSIKRAMSHIKFASNLKKTIKKLKKPDLIYSAYPTMSASYVAGRYAKKNNLPFIIDIQDTWPESISSAINTRKFFVKLLMWPFTSFANRIYKMADAVIGVSETYAQRANVKGTKCKEFIPVYIGTELKKFSDDYYEQDKIHKKEQDIWITYIGTLSHSYDIDTAIKAFAQLKEYKNIKLNILGSGPDEIRLVELAKKLNVYDQNVYFYGYVNYEKMVHILKKSDIGLNAIKGSAKQTITNKLSDYVSAGLPILNSCQEREILNLMINKELGINYNPGNVDSLRNSILKMISCRETMKKYSRNSRLFAEKYFDRKESYKVIIDLIKRIDTNNAINHVRCNMNYYVYVEGILGVKTNSSKFKWVYGVSAPKTTESEFEKCKIKIVLDVRKSKEVFDKTLNIDDYDKYNYFFARKNERKIYYERNFIFNSKLRYSIKVIGNDYLNVIVSKNYFKHIKYRFMNLHSLGYILTDLASGFLLINGYCTIHCSAVKVKDKAIVIFGPPNTGKTLTAIKLCELDETKFIAEDIALIDGENVYAVPWTSTFRNYNHYKESKLDTLANMLSSKIPILQLFSLKSKSIIDYIGCGRILIKSKITDVVVLGKGDNEVLKCNEGIFESIINLNKYEFNYHRSPTMLVMNYFNPDLSIDRMFDLEKSILSKMINNSDLYRINAKSTLDYWEIIRRIL